MRTDSELVRATLAGQREAAGEIYDRYVPLVRGIVRDGRFTLTESDEVVQEVFLRVLSHLSSLRQPDHLAGWIVQITRNQIADCQRRAVKARQREGPVIEELVDTRAVMTIDVHQRVHAAIAQLSENERLAVHIYYLSEEPAEVARQSLGLSASGFYKTIEKARSRLRALLSTKEVHQ
jgi:RNA polymerase sigma factor (sigma-70 family)